ncbi:MAG: DUF1211 domain-containing protein [Acidobacteriia bacterium]|nr:DUF1211 domain-containing protein [Terriglobia bacterium]
MPSTTGERAQDEKETGRLEAFSDGVFGIAITLLVLDIKVPRALELADRSTLEEALWRQWPTHASYVLSFVTVLIMWTNHHKVFRLIRRSDHTFLLINGLLLMFVTLMPFPTSLLAEHLAQPGGATAAAVYSGTFVLIAALFNALWHYAAHHGRLLARGYDREAAQAITRQYRFGPALYLAAFLLAFVNVWASVGLCAGLAAFFALPDSGNRKLRE